jgi:hypothetical protein
MRQVVKAVDVLHKHARHSHQVRFLEIDRQGRIVVGHKQRVAGRQFGDKFRVD